MVDTLDLKSNLAKGYRFKSDDGHLNALLAQLVERLIPNQKVIGSTPIQSTGVIVQLVRILVLQAKDIGSIPINSTLGV